MEIFIRDCDHAGCVFASMSYACFFLVFLITFFFFQAEDGIRDLVRSRGLGDVYKRQTVVTAEEVQFQKSTPAYAPDMLLFKTLTATLPPIELSDCLLYTSEAADERSSVDLGGRRIIKKKNSKKAAARSTHQK